MSGYDWFAAIQIFISKDYKGSKLPSRQPAIKVRFQYVPVIQAEMLYVRVGSLPVL